MFDNWNMVVIGAGTMGHGIALTFAVNGFNTAVVDTSDEKLEDARKKIAANLEILVQFGEVTQAAADQAETLITYTVKLEDVAPSANFVSEAVFESSDVKRPIYAQLDKLCSPDCILSSSTSALNIFDIAQVSNPGRLIIAHWFNPPHIMPLVEVVKGPQTSEATVEKVMLLLKQIGKSPALINQYIPGFIINRLSSALSREASHMITQGWVTAEDIDSAIINTYGLRYPFEGHMQLYDYVGWDVVLNVSTTMSPQLCSSTEPNALARDLVAQGRLGVKTGKGIADYSNVDVAKMQRDRIFNILKIRQAVKALKNE